MSIKMQAHYAALKELMELMTIAFILALFTDACWVIRDILINGLTIGMVFIALGLWVSTLITFIAFYKYHIKQVKQTLKNILNEKLQYNKKRARLKMKHDRKEHKK